MESHERLLNVAEAAALLRMSRSRIYQLAEAGKIPSHQLYEGGRVLFKPAELMAALKPRQPKPDAHV